MPNAKTHMMHEGSLFLNADFVIGGLAIGGLALVGNKSYSDDFLSGYTLAVQKLDNLSATILKDME